MEMFSVVCGFVVDLSFPCFYLAYVVVLNFV